MIIIFQKALKKSLERQQSGETGERLLRLVSRSHAQKAAKCFIALLITGQKINKVRYPHDGFSHAALVLCLCNTTVVVPADDLYDTISKQFGIDLKDLKVQTWPSKDDDPDTDETVEGVNTGLCK